MSKNGQPVGEGKLLRADLHLRQRVVSFVPLATIGLIAGFFFVMRRLRSFDTLPGNPCVHAADLARLLNISASVAASITGLAAVMLLWVGYHGWRQGVFPPEQMPVMRDTQQAVGSAASLRILAAVSVSIALLSVTVYLYYRVYALIGILNSGC